MTFSLRANVQKELERLLVREELMDPTWAVTLDEFDEPPLFLRYSDAEFLRALPPLERALSVVDFAVGQLDRMRTAAHDAPAGTVDDLFACVTLHWWDEVASGEAATVCPRFQVVPRHSDEHDAGARFLTSQTANGRQVDRWLEIIERRDLVAAEVTPDEFGRVYVGYRSPGTLGFKSVGDFLEA